MKVILKVHGRQFSSCAEYNQEHNYSLWTQLNQSDQDCINWHYVCCKLIKHQRNDCLSITQIL